MAAPLRPEPFLPAPWLALDTACLLAAADIRLRSTAINSSLLIARMPDTFFRRARDFQLAAGAVPQDFDRHIRLRRLVQDQRGIPACSAVVRDAPGEVKRSILPQVTLSAHGASSPSLLRQGDPDVATHVQQAPRLSTNRLATGRNRAMRNGKYHDNEGSRREKARRIDGNGQGALGRPVALTFNTRVTQGSLQKNCCESS